MFTLIQLLPLRQLLTHQLPAFTLSFVIAERFYKLGSFALECLAFLATWFVIDGAVRLILGFWNRMAGREG